MTTLANNVRGALINGTNINTASDFVRMGLGNVTDSFVDRDDHLKVSIQSGQLTIKAGYAMVKTPSGFVLCELTQDYTETAPSGTAHIYIAVDTSKQLLGSQTNGAQDVCSINIKATQPTTGTFYLLASVSSGAVTDKRKRRQVSVQNVSTIDKLPANSLLLTDANGDYKTVSLGNSGEALFSGGPTATPTWSNPIAGLSTASESVTGITRLATQTQVNQGTNNTHPITPAKLKVHLNSREQRKYLGSINGSLGVSASSTSTQAGVLPAGTKRVIMRVHFNDRTYNMGTERVIIVGSGMQNIIGYGNNSDYVEGSIANGNVTVSVSGVGQGGASVTADCYT